MTFAVTWLDLEECHTEWSKPDREKEIPYDILYVWNLKRMTQTKVKSLSCVQLFGTPRTAACQAPPSMEFSRQGYWSGLPSPSPGDLPNPGIEPRSPALQADSSLSEPPRKPWWYKWTYLQNRKRFKDWEHKIMVATGKGWGLWKIMHTMLYLKWITNKDILYHTRNSAQCYVPAWMGGGFREEWIQVYIWLSPFTLFTWNIANQLYPNSK